MPISPRTHLDESGDSSLSLLVLVDREDQVEKVSETIRGIRRSARVPSALFEFHGAPGIGKSSLIQLLDEKCHALGVPSAVINFNRANERVRLAYADDPTLLVWQIAIELRDRAATLQLPIAVDLSRLERATEQFHSQPHPQQIVLAYAGLNENQRLYDRPDWLNNLRNITAELIEIIRLIGRAEADVNTNTRQPVAILFDETDQADTALVDWIEENLIDPLSQMKHCVIVWTSRRAWRWRLPQVRRRMQIEQLESFDEQTVKKQFVKDSPNNPDLAEMLFGKVFEVSGGHPYASHQVIARLNDIQNRGGEVTPGTFDDYERELLQDIYDVVIRGRALSGVPKEVRWACKLMGLVRLFDTTMLRQVIVACDGVSDVRFPHQAQEDFGDLMLKLKRTQLLVWKKGYAIDDSLRYLLRRYFAKCDVDVYRKANAAALKVYQDWLTKPVDNRGLFVIEALYHLACLWEIGEDVSLTKALHQQLSNYSDHWFKNDTEAHRNALEQLEGELERDDELEQRAGQDMFRQLLKQVQDAVNRIPRHKNGAGAQPALLGAN